MDFLARFNTNKVFIRPERAELAGVARPAYPKQESGVCLVVGTHPCVNDDIDAALLKYPGAHFCAVNEASAIVPAHHIATCHGDKLEIFIKAHEETWGLLTDDNLMHEPPVIHIRDMPEAKTDRECHRWETTIGAGSAPFAAAVMAAIGYEPIIFCGCPLEGGGGYALDTHASTMDDPRFGFLDANHSMVQAWHGALVAMKEQHPEICGKFRSMSGFTKELFGGIE